MVHACQPSSSFKVATRIRRRSCICGGAGLLPFRHYIVSSSLLLPHHPRWMIIPSWKRTLLCSFRQVVHAGGSSGGIGGARTASGAGKLAVAAGSRGIVAGRSSPGVTSRGGWTKSAPAGGSFAGAPAGGACFSQGESYQGLAGSPWHPGRGSHTSFLGEGSRCFECAKDSHVCPHPSGVVAREPAAFTPTFTLQPLHAHTPSSADRRQPEASPPHRPALAPPAPARPPSPEEARSAPAAGPKRGKGGRVVDRAEARGRKPDVLVGLKVEEVSAKSTQHGG
ncbi:hypothetical protein VTI74DRAFT_7561 [Chaetomium olivicolor]